ncbi:hypothetical protein [Daejeonella sp. JGW-45]|uniref:hypothetical protein n=1 Tax=Daejeonella sp. JGW-45 TaxID=3034148 RepID=UPI0023EB4A6F|nr:hypothetical protein [Daejeonella sp. JGW-45]
MQDYKSKLGSLADKLKNDQPKTPIQEVHPVKATTPIKSVEVQLNTWIPKSLLKRIKAYGLEQDLSLKEINIQALELFLEYENKGK